MSYIYIICSYVYYISKRSPYQYIVANRYYVIVDPMEYCNNGKMLYIKPPAYEWLNMSSRFHAALFAIFNETFFIQCMNGLWTNMLVSWGNEVEIMRHSHVPTNIFQEWQFFFRLILIITFYAYLHSILLRHFFMFL